MPAKQNHATNIGVIVLAAGASSRLGKPKQSLLYKGKTLLQHTISTALASPAQPVVVVLGANEEVLETKDSDVQVVVNAQWQEGMASSIRCGLEAFTRRSSTADGIILMVCDQPFVTAMLLNHLVEAHQKTGKPIVASGYDNTFGPPVFFHHTFFEELRTLTGDTGARSIVRRHKDAAEIIPFPQGSFDIDTEADYNRLLQCTRSSEAK